MKKLIGIFAIWSTALALASCSSESELSKAFKTALSNPNFLTEEELGDGTYTSSIYTSLTTGNITEVYDFSRKIAIDGDNIALEHNEDYIKYWDTTLLDSSTTNIIFSELNGDDDELYVYTEDSVDESNIIKKLLEQYGEFYPDISLDDMGDYEYAKLSTNGDNFSGKLLLYELSGVTLENDNSNNYNNKYELDDEHNLDFSDLLVKDFTTYDSVSDTVAYATINFNPFDSDAFEIMFNLLNLSLSDSGVSLPPSDMIKAIESLSDQLPDCYIQFIFGMDPSTNTINYFKMDYEPFYKAFDDPSEFYVEIKFDESVSQITLPDSDKAIDGAKPFKEESYDALSYGVVDFLEHLTVFINNGYGDYLDISSLNSALDRTLGEYYNTEKPLWIVLFDTSTPVVTKENGYYYIQFKWADGTDVFVDKLLITDDRMELYDNARNSIIEENFKLEFLFMITA